MIKPSSDLVMRLQPDRLSKPAGQLVMEDRLRIVDHFRELVENSWPPERSANPVAAALQACIKCLEADIRAAG